ncbi:DsbA family oxidoreductase [Amaricoccus tamworthensis]|uniref:DsbA family oxidoreductase n=1 Tax=Amaricoccus tamworthensis TaxID=57002 RepID=UPI003C7EA4D6
MTRLEIISDPICPWCYIGVTRLMKAIEARPHYEFALNWRPYQLNPGMPFEGMDRKKYLIDKFGGQEGAVRVYSQIEQAAKDTGLNIDFGSIKRTPNTLNALRLIHWAAAERVQTPVAMSLFRAYFHEGRDIGDSDTLADIADSCGMDRAVIRKLLDGDADAHEVHNDSLAARDMGVTGVPTFILGGKYALSGAQPVDTWTKLIDELTAAIAAS